MNAVEERNVIPMPMSETQQSPHTPPPAPVQEVANLGNLEKIREILFGGQMREYDRRFARLEERLLKEASEAREDSRRRFEALEHFIKQEVAALGERLRAENQQRSQSSEEITRELRDTSRNLWQKINQLDEQSSNTHRELRQQILDQSRLLSDDIRHNYENISLALARESKELRNDKTDRAALADLFTEIAMRLKNEFKLPGEE